MFIQLIDLSTPSEETNTANYFIIWYTTNEDGSEIINLDKTIIESSSKMLQFYSHSNNTIVIKYDSWQVLKDNLFDMGFEELVDN